MNQRLKGKNDKFFTTPLSRHSQRRLDHKENQTKFRSDQKASESCYNLNISNGWPDGKLPGSASR